MGNGTYDSFSRILQHLQQAKQVLHSNCWDSRHLAVSCQNEPHSQEPELTAQTRVSIVSNVNPLRIHLLMSHVPITGTSLSLKKMTAFNLDKLGAEQLQSEGAAAPIAKSQKQRSLASCTQSKKLRSRFNAVDLSTKHHKCKRKTRARSRSSSAFPTNEDSRILRRKLCMIWQHG
jgi:hypothetical protein